MKKQNVIWKIYGFEIETIRRYCHNCGHVSEFRDSGKIRRNANGKDIFVYAVYKCGNDHTWNRLLRSHKAGAVADDAFPREKEKSAGIGVIDLAASSAEGHELVEIVIEEAEGRVRIDRLLAGNLRGLSRCRIATMIENGRITVDARQVKPGYAVREGDVITIMLPTDD